MRQVIFLIALMALSTSGIGAQDALSLSQKIHQIPDEDGVYYSGPEVSAPKLLRVVFAPYPSDVPSRSLQGMTVLAMVIGADGIPAHIQVLKTHGEAFDRGAIAAVMHSVFEPGRLRGKPVPVWIDVRFVFTADQQRAVPQVLITERDLPPPAESQLEDKHHRPLANTPPFAIHTVDADFTDPFAKHPFVQVAIVEVLVTDQGLPKQVHVRRGLGFGLDDKAAAAVMHYKFLPATDKGKPVEALREVMVNFTKF